MSNELLASKIVIEEEEPRVRTIAGVSTNDTGFVGVTERGPVGVATLVTSVDEYDTIFGGYTANGDVRQAVDGFFQNGGQRAWIVRVVHYTDPLDAATLTALRAVVSLQNSAPVATLKLHGKTHGTYAHAYNPKILAASNGEAARFNLQILKGGIIVESFPNLTMDPADARYVEKIVNSPIGSKFVEAEDLLVVGNATVKRPANVTGSVLASGNDGLTSLADTDFVGASTEDGKTGMRCLDAVQSLNLLTVPGRATSAVQNAMITYCEIVRGKSVFAIFDPPAGATAQSVIEYFETTAAILGVSEFGAAYWPRIRVLNPNKTLFGADDTLVVPPSGHIAGVYARTDAAKLGGVYTPPAGVEVGIVQGCLGFETDEVLEEPKRDLVYPKRINPITALTGAGRFLDGTKTLKGNGSFPSIAERRGVIFIEQSIKDGIQYARHKNNDEELRQSVTRSVESFLGAQTKFGAFRSKDPAKAFFVDFGEGLNTTAVQFAGQLIGRIGVATQKPADFIVLRFSQDTRALEEELAA